MKFVKLAKIYQFIDTPEYKDIEFEITAYYAQCFKDGSITVEQFLNYMKKIERKYTLAKSKFEQEQERINKLKTQIGE